MFAIDEFRTCLERVATILRGCRVRFFITGGAAFVAYGDPRTTQDVDLVVDVVRLRESLPTVVELLRNNQFLIDEHTIRRALHSQSQFQLFDMVSSLKLDLYPQELVGGELDRAVEIELFPGVPFPVASRPDLALSKLIWISKGSHKSRRDLKQILLRATEEETATVRETAKKLTLLDLLDEVLAEPDEIDA